MTVDDFVAAFGAVLEDSPHLARAAAAHRPFPDADALGDAFDAVVRALEEDDALALLRAHPELGTARPMAAASVAEQASAGLPGAAEAQQVRLAEGNAAYRARFDFPFIIAVRGRTPDEIITELEGRVRNDRSTELATALDQVCAIARIRVSQLVAAS